MGKDNIRREENGERKKIEKIGKSRLLGLLFFLWGYGVSEVDEWRDGE